VKFLKLLALEASLKLLMAVVQQEIRVHWKGLVKAGVNGLKIYLLMVVVVRD
jgi:hypothetical protein